MKTEAQRFFATLVNIPHDDQTLTFQMTLIFYRTFVTTLDLSCVLIIMIHIESVFKPLVCSRLLDGIWDRIPPRARVSLVSFVCCQVEVSA